MLTSRKLSYLIGAATVWLPLYLMGFIVLSVILVATQPDIGRDNGPPTGFVVLAVLHLLTILLSLALLAVYLVDVFRNPDLSHRQDLRIMWVVLVLALNGFAMVVYWWLFLRPGSDSFQRRTNTPQRVT